MSTKTNKRKRTAAAGAAGKAATKTAEVAVEPVSAPAPLVQESVAQDNVVASDAAASSIALASHCTVKDAAGLKDELLQLLEAPTPVVIDAASVERVDTAIMQLLCAFVRDRAERNLGVDWLGVPHALRDAARLLGVAPMLALPAEAA